nr:ABC transporter permease [Leptospira perolatii]
MSVLLSEIRSVNRGFLFADSGMSQEDRQKLSQREDLTDRYLRFVKGMVTFDLGLTESGELVLAHLASRFWPTFHLASFAIIGSVLGSLILAFFSLSTVNVAPQKFLNILSQLILSTPVFVVAILLLVVFFLILGWLPPGGYESWNISFVILPGIALGSRVWARLYRFTFRLAETELEGEYVRVLRARGYSEQRILYRHILLKILPVLLVLILLDFSSLLSGAIVVEEIFFFPGIGKSMYHAIRTMDSSLLAALLFYSGLIFYLMGRISEKVRDRLLGWEEEAK